MTNDARDAYTADDAILLNLVREGDTEAYDVLYHRHEQAAYRLAHCLVPAQEADDLVAETFGRILDVIQDGSGPAGAFRPYLLTALRRVSSDWLDPQHTDARGGSAQLPDPGEPLIDPAVTDLATSQIAQAFLSLPDRWIAVLWHTEIEQNSPAEVGEILELYPGEVATLCHRAWDGLRQAYVQMEIEDGAPPECQPILRLLAAFVGDTASSDDHALVSEHLSYCDECDPVWAELADVDAAALRTVVAPVFLGSTAQAYLSVQDTGAARTAAGAAREPMGTGEWEQLELESGRPRHASTRSRRASRPSLWIAGVTVAAGLVVLALAVTRPGTSPTSAHHQQLPQAAGAPTPDGTGTATPTRSPRPGATTDPAGTQQPGSPGGRAGSDNPAGSGSAGTGPSTGSGGHSPAPSPKPSPTPSPTPTPTPTPTPSPTPTPTPTLGPAPTLDPTPTPSATPTPSPSSLPATAQLSVTVSVSLGPTTSSGLSTTPATPQ